jgi:hypothetical protein
MKNQTESKALETAIQPIATVTVRTADQLEKLVTFNNDGTATFKAGADFNPYEIGAYAATRANDAQSASLKAVAMLRIARKLPKVKVPKASKPEETYERDAFEVACEECAKLCVTASAWQNVKGLITAVDIAEANQLEPYKVKNSLGYLNKLGLIDEKTLKLKDSAKSDVGVQAILDKGVKSNAVVKKLNDAKLAHNAEAKAQKKEVPFPSLERKTTAPAPAVTTAQTDATPESVARIIASAWGLWDKLVGINAANVAKLREACKGDLEKLVKLAGCKLVSL